MHPIVEYWPYVNLAARYRHDSDPTNNDPDDYININLRKWHPEAIGIHEVMCGIGNPETVFHLDNGNYSRELADKNPLNPYSYVIELDDRIIVAHLGTRNNADMLTNFTGAISGAVRNINPLIKKDDKHGCHDSYWNQGVETFKTLLPWIRHAKASGKYIAQTAHSKGCGRAAVVARLAVEYGFPRPLTMLYSPPPMWTKDGAKKYWNLGLGECTYSAISGGDIVSKASMFGYYRHCGMIIQLPDVSGNFADIPLVGEHAYSTVNNELIVFCRKNMKDEEGARYLESRAYVSVC